MTVTAAIVMYMEVVVAPGEVREVHTPLSRTPTIHFQPKKTPGAFLMVTSTTPQNKIYLDFYHSLVVLGSHHPEAKDSLLLQLHYGQRSMPNNPQENQFSLNQNSQKHFT